MTDNEFLEKIKALMFDYAMTTNNPNITCGDIQKAYENIEELVKKPNSAN